MLNFLKSKHSVRVGFFSIVALLLSSCKIETPPVTLTVSPGPIQVNSGSLTCAASTSLASVISGQSFPVTIQVVGGVGPYTLNGLSGTFLTSYTLPQSLTLTGTNSQVTTTSFTVTDTAGTSTTCSLALTVSPTTTTNPLSCSVAASTDNPAVNQAVNYTATATGGSGTYFFTGFIPGGSGVTTASLNQNSPTTATAGARYPTSGLNTSVFYIADSSGNSATCAKTVNVQSQSVASVSLSASPSSTIPANQTMTITATPTGFSGTPTYTFSVSGTGLNLSASGATATVTAVDSTITRTGTVSVTAVFGSETATSSLPVTFTAQSSTLNCSITYPSGTYQPGQSVPFTIAATTGESLNVTFIEVQDGYVVGGVPSQNPSIAFYYTGTKYVKALARSASTGTLCNNGNFVQTSIYISPTSTQFSCTLTMTPNPTNTYTWILATAQGNGAQGVYWIESLTANSTNSMLEEQSYSSSYSSGSPAYRYVYFTRSGSFLVTARLRDSAGRTATCQTYQTIYSNVSTTPVERRYCGIWPATGAGACATVYTDTYYYDGTQCRHHGKTSSCASAGAFGSYSQCVDTVNAGLCGSW